jgi:uncharacterized membrane protein YbhN (UPF0104 family)
MSKRFITTVVQYLIFLGIGFLFAWLSLRNLNEENWRQLKLSLQQAQLWLSVPVCGLLLLSHYLRGLRWKLLIDPLGYSVKPFNSFLTVLLGYLVNLGVPRLGEFMRCTALGRYEKISVEKLVGTVISERLFDGVCLLLVFCLTLGLQPHLYESIVGTFSKNPAESTAASGEPNYLLFILAGLLVLMLGWMVWKKRKPSDLLQLIQTTFLSLMTGLLSIKKLEKPKQFLLLTISIWMLYLLAGYVGFLAFPQTSKFGMAAALTILSVGSIGMIVSPGGIGAYAYLVLYTMQLYGLEYSTALAFGWTLWLVQTLVILLGGVISFILLPWYNRE